MYPRYNPSPIGDDQNVIEKFLPRLAAILPERYTFQETQSKTNFSEKLMAGKWEVRDEHKGLIASFELVPMINCCGIVVSTRAVVNGNWQHKGLGTLLNEIRIAIARALGYGLLLCTDDTGNAYQRKILSRNGWKDIYSFINPRTKNNVALSVIPL